MQREKERDGERAPLWQNQDFLPRRSCDGDNVANYCYRYVILHQYLMSQGVICLELTKTGICGGVNKRSDSGSLGGAYSIFH